MKNKKSIIIGLLSLAFAASIANADTEINPDPIFTPDRPGIDFTQGITDGLSYPSFNNFTGNTNILGARNGDERNFMIAKYCEDGVCCTGFDDPDNMDCYYGNIVDQVKEGDVIRFEIYFHNNGSDPYDEHENKNSPDAKNIRIGIDLADISAEEGELDYMIRPKGFIKADNNEYRTNPKEYSTIIKDSSGKILRTATDDIQSFLAEYDLYLEPMPEKTYLAMKRLNLPDGTWEWEYADYVKNNITISFDTESGETVDTNITNQSQGKKAWLHFDKLPGCFRYSGFAYFDAKVVKKEEPEKPNVCESIIFNYQAETINNKNGNRFTIKPEFIKFSKSLPPKTTLKWETTDPNGIFYKESGWLDLNPFGGDDDEPEWIQKGNGPLTNEPFLSHIGYVGAGLITVTVEGYPECNHKIAFQPQKQECETLKVNHQNPIYTNQISKFTAKAVDKDGEVFNGKIKYSVTKGYGTFYIFSPNNTEKNTSPLVPEFTKTSDIIEPSGGFCDEEGEIVFNPSVGFSSIFAIDEKHLAFIPYGNELIVDPGDTVYFVGTKEGQNVITVETECTEQESCSREFSITGPPEPEILECVTGTMSAIISGTKTTPECIKSDETYIFKQEFFTNMAKTQKIPFDKMKVTWISTDPNGRFYDITAPLNPKKSPYIGSPLVIYKGGGTIISKFYEAGGVNDKDKNCVNYIKSCEEPPPPPPKNPVCEELTTNATPLIPGKFYEITSSVTYDQADYKNTITYNIDPNYGAFLDKEITEFDKLLLMIWEDVGFPKTKTLEIFSQYTTSKLDSVQNNEKVYLITYGDVTNPKPDVLKINATNFHNTDCYKTFPLIIPQIPKRCESLYLSPANGSFDPAKEYQIINIKGDYSNHNGEIIVTSNNGKISKFEANKEEYKYTLAYSRQEVADSGNNLVFVYKKDPNYDGMGKVNIQAYALGAESRCSDSLDKDKKDIVCVDLDIVEPDYPWKIDEDDDDDLDKEFFEIEVETSPPNMQNEFLIHWESDDGEWKNNDAKGEYYNYLLDFDKKTTVMVWAEYKGKNVCEDTIKTKIDEEEEEKAPKLEKYVFPENEVDEANDFLTMGNSDVVDYVTYAVTFEPGSAASAQIKESSMSNGKIYGDLGGKFEFLGMRINVLKKDGEQYTILQDAGYKSDNDTSPLGDKNYKTAFDYDDDDFEADDYFGSTFKCKNGTNTPCIDGDFEDIIDDFMKGETIEFKNLDKLVDKNFKKGSITIKYQMKNLANINEDICETLTIAQGCGEKFRNKVRFDAWIEDEPNGVSDWDGKDEAKVIVICPFILQRQGGDAFFHDEIDIGIDVSQCSDVKGGDGPGITPKPPPTPGAPETGIGDIPEEVKLLLPSHDVCQYSNLESNIEDYNDVLKNFSSTICEMRAEVAEEWKETHINAEIEAKIELLTAWSNNLDGVSKINNASSLNVDNAQSGVFVKKNGNLEINLTTTNNELPYDDIPAAQTYIVIGGNLTINSNIKYPEIEKEDYYDPKNIPSAAFIVIDGNIIINNDVNELHGAFIALNTDGEGDDGKITTDNPNGTPTTKLLVVHGNLIGNVFELFKMRKGVGDPKKNQGSITIYFDQSIILNPPPGLGDLIDIERLKSVN